MNDAMFSELFGGSGRFHVLRQLFENPDKEFSTRQLATAAAVDSGNTHRWLQRWESAGLVCRSKVNPLLYRSSRNPALRPLTELFGRSKSMANELRELLTSLEKVESAAIFGSVARNAEEANSDVDILVLGNISELKLNALLRPMARAYAREFNASVFSPERFAELLAQGDEFACDVMANTLLTLKGELRVQDAH
jgi:hypothetical protein